MQAYHHPEKDASFTPYFEKLLISAQGNLFSVRALGLSRRRGKTSCASDLLKWENAQLAARHAIMTFCADMKTYSPALPFYLATSKVVDQIAGKLLQLGSQSIRGAIYEFSKRSRGRLLRLGARLDQNVVGVMVTCTYRENMRDHARAKAQLQLLGKWMLYHYPHASLLWRLEYQKRGAIHFHILALNINYVDAIALTSYWQKMTGDESFPDVKRIRSRRQVMSYISKYLAKNEQAEQAQAADTASDGFINVPYLENFVGRFWGVINRKALPLATEHKIMVVGSPQLLFNLRRYARRKWPGLSRRVQGFTLFTNNSSAWMKLTEYELMRPLQS